MARLRIFLLSIVLFSIAAPAFADHMADTSLPFKAVVTEEKMDPLPEYMGPKNPTPMDFPYSPVEIDGEYWIIYCNGYRDPVVRYKGTNIENGVRQPDGARSFPINAPYILGGMWYDKEAHKLYAPLHCEVWSYAGWPVREVHLASSTDKGLTWKYEGPLITLDDPVKKVHPTAENSGLYWNDGDGDHSFSSISPAATPTCSPIITTIPNPTGIPRRYVAIAWLAACFPTGSLQGNGRSFTTASGMSRGSAANARSSTAT